MPSVELPFEKHGNRQFFTFGQVEDLPEVEDFVRRFPACFECDFWFGRLYFYPQGDSPKPYFLRPRGQKIPNEVLHAQD